MKKSIELTAEGLAKIKDEHALKSGPIRKTLVNTLDELRSDGDLSENEGYKLALDQFQDNETRILELEEIIKNAKVVSECKNKTVCLGSTVRLQSVETKEISEYTVVNENEVDPLQKKVSQHSPIGIAVLGRKIGDEVIVHTPNGTKQYKIVK